MGIDWTRAQLRPDADVDLVRRLIEQQAIAAQTLFGWESTAAGEVDGVGRAIRDRLHGPAYAAASVALRGLLDVAAWDDERGCAADLPDLAAGWRVYPITRCPVLPPLWRALAHRTFLPDELTLQLGEWRRWTEQVRRGERDEYLRDLHAHATADWMRYHWTCLRGAAIDSLGRNSAWANKPALAETRDAILRLPEPAIPDVDIDPAGGRVPRHRVADRNYGPIFEQAAELARLTRAWDQNVRDNHKLRYYEDGYCLDFAAFKAAADDDWLHAFLAWAGECAERGMVLFFDY